MDASRRPHRPSRAGFTFIEVIIVLLLLGLLAAIAIPRLVGIQAAAQATTVGGSLSSASAANVAVCRQRGLDHDACVQTADFAGKTNFTFVDDENPGEFLVALYGIHIEGHPADEGKVEGDAFPESEWPDWEAELDHPLHLGCEEGEELSNYQNIGCWIAVGDPASTASDDSVVETFQLTYIDRAGEE